MSYQIPDHNSYDNDLLLTNELLDLTYFPIYDILNVILNFSDNEFNENKILFVSKLQYVREQFLLNIINEQEPINGIYMLYKQSLLDMSFSCITPIEIDINKRVIDIIINIDGEDLTLNAISPYDLSEYIKKYENKQRLFLLVGYGCVINDADHRAVIMIDNAEKSIYLIDPNGGPSYFNRIFGQSLEYSVETMLNNFFAELLNFGLEYKYIYSNIWNDNNIIINTKFNNGKYGFCVTITYILINILSQTKHNPEYILKILKMIPKSELFDIIKKYSIGIYNIFN